MFNRILQIHNYYKYAGGEDYVVNNEKKLLEDNNIEVYQFIKRNDELSFWGKLKLLKNTNFSTKSFHEILSVIRKIKPDVVHVHNFFPQISPAVFWASKRSNIPVVMTLHNYRLMYPNGLLMKDSVIDERTINNSAYICVPDKVYRNSYLQTAVVAHMIEYHRRKNTWNSKVDRLIALTEFARSKFIDFGIDQDKIIVKPNFISDYYKKTNGIAGNEEYFIYVGRISPEKGIRELIAYWINHNIKSKLIIIGDGPLFDELTNKSASYSRIAWKGKLNRETVLDYIKSAQALIFPSNCYEGFPLTIVEAFSLETPVLSTDIGSQSEIVINGYNGLHYKHGCADDFLDKIKTLSDKRYAKKLGNNARIDYLEKYTAEKNYEILSSIYNSVLEKK